MNLLRITLPLEVALSHVNMDFCAWLCENEESGNIRFTARNRKLSIIFRAEDAEWITRECNHYVLKYKHSIEQNMKVLSDKTKQLLTL